MSLTLKAFLGYLVSKTFAVSGSPSAHYWRLCIYRRPQNTYCQKTSGQCKIPMMSIAYVMLVLMKVLKSQTTVQEPNFCNTQDWQLQIQGVLAYDSGRYLCQATSHPPTAIITTLVVVGG